MFITNNVEEVVMEC